MFQAETVYVKHIHSTLKCVDFAKECTVEITNRGIRFGVDESQSLQAHIFIDRGLFQKYIFEDDEENSNYLFKTRLAPLLQCLSIYTDGKDKQIYNPWDQQPSTNTMHKRGVVCKIHFEGIGYPFEWEVEEMAGYSTICELSTLEYEENIDVSRLATTLNTKVIMRSGWLYDALLELDNNLSESLMIETSSQKSTFILRCIGGMSTTEMEYPNEKNVLESFETNSEYTYTYRFSLIRQAIKALQAGTKVSLRIDENGTLNIQLMLVGQDGLCTFVDFRIAPLDLMIEDEGDDEGNLAENGYTEDDNDQEDYNTEEEDD
ncbi:checkpoint clamp complex protein Rad1 [Schizosaccharomyces osmophilus]|uniref:Checkpoint clamp complex protein Rad1 n=1 Tax=Schizosaccharomyces osmophilus TaxID=2545709 RepID=A0AAE9WBJ7_9SCHI|nr:checkpoint clamp complex protein Rad1 [Schizosaccharomyces osmophilus]WBW73327.1 checkpoint clamp complex protein Rad1 [Schizosaccharomyces osmophilus]